MRGCCLLSPFGFLACNFFIFFMLPSLLSSLFLTHCLFFFFFFFFFLSLPPFLFFFFFCFAVSATLRYGYYGDSLILLGPVSSRLITTSSVFVKQLQVSTKDKNQVFIHTFNKKPQLSSQTNWTASDFFLVEPYKNKVNIVTRFGLVWFVLKQSPRRMSLKKLTFQLQVISLWLNQGSTIRIRWEEHTTTGLDKLHGMVVKGHACLSFYTLFLV